MQNCKRYILCVCDRLLSNNRESIFWLKPFKLATFFDIRRSLFSTKLTKMRSRGFLRSSKVIFYAKRFEWRGCVSDLWWSHYDSSLSFRTSPYFHNNKQFASPSKFLKKNFPKKTNHPNFSNYLLASLLFRG